MTKTLRKIIVYILVVALVFSLVGCSSSETETEVMPEMEMPGFPEGEMPFGEMPEEEDAGFTDPSATQTPSSGADVVVKAEMSDAYGVYLYSYETEYTSDNYVIIRLDSEELLSMDLFITEVDLRSYSGDAELDDSEVVPDLKDEIQINSTKMKEYWAEGSGAYQYFVALARDDEGEYYQVEYATEGYWQSVEDEKELDSDEEIYIGLPLTEAGTYEIEITFEIKDSEDAYQFGYFEKEIEDGISFTLTADSKISKSKAEIIVLPQILAYDEDGNGTDVYSAYIELTEDNIADYIRVEVDGEENEDALSELTKIVDYDKAYAYVYIDETLYEDSKGSNTTIYLAFMDTTGKTGNSVNDDNHIEDGDLMWINYEFTITENKWYVFDDSTYSTTASDIGSVINAILTIEYSDGDFSSQLTDSTISKYVSAYEALSTSEQAYLQAMASTVDSANGDIEIDSGIYLSDFANMYYYTNYDPEDYDGLAVYFRAWYYDYCDNEYEDYTGYDLINYLEAAEEYIEEITLVEAFEEVLDNYDLWKEDNTATFSWDGEYYESAVTNMVTFNELSTTMVSNLESVLLYLDEMSSDDREVIENRASITYAYILYCEELIVTDDVEDVMADISAVVAKYLVSDLTNTLLYVDLDDEDTANNALGYEIGLDATHVIYSTSLFVDIERALDEYYDLAPEKQDMLAEYTFTVLNSQASGSAYSNYYYFNSEIIATGNEDSASFTITYADALFALEEMMEVAQEINTIFSYIDYMSFFDTDIARDRYIDLVFGSSDPDFNDLIYGNGNGLFYISTDDEEDQNKNWAIQDIAKAYEESDVVKEAIIAEYTEFIELLIYIEEYKLEITDEFIKEVYNEVNEDNDYSTRTVAMMESAIDDYVDMILEEITVTAGTDYSEYTAFTSKAMVDVIEYIFSEGFEDMDEAKDLVEDCFDVDELVEQFIKNKGLEQD